MNLTKSTHSVTMPPCSGCNNNTGRLVINDHGHETGILVCDGCGGLLGRCYRGDSPVLMVFSPGADDGVQPNVETTDADAVYFDLDLLGSAGVERVHGFFNPADRKVLQFG